MHLVAGKSSARSEYLRVLNDKGCSIQGWMSRTPQAEKQKWQWAAQATPR